VHRYIGRLFLLLSHLALVSSSFVIAQDVVRKPLVVGYFGQWGLYNDPQYTLKDLAADNKIALLDQLNYAQGFVTGGRCSIADRNADLDHNFAADQSVDGKADDASSPFRGHLHQLAKLKLAHPSLRVLISLEGHANDFAFDAQPENRKVFVASCVDLFIKGNLGSNISAPGIFDGIDVDWEYPQGADAANFVALLAEFRTQMNAVRPGLTLSVAVGPSPHMYQGTDLASVAAEVDEVGLMTYDFAGPWMQTTGFIAPLYGVPPQLEVTDKPVATLPVAGTQPSGGAAGSVQAFLAAGVPAAKLLLGVPFYGYGWTQVPEIATGVYQEGTPVRGDRPYSYIQSLTASSKIYRDPVSKTPWLFDGDVFWTFDDPVSVEAKASYAVEHGLGGVMIWELSGDTPQGALLKGARRGLTQTVQTSGT
jgi:chitinase